MGERAYCADTWKVAGGVGRLGIPGRERSLQAKALGWGVESWAGRASFQQQEAAQVSEGNTAGERSGGQADFVLPCRPR